MSYPADKFALEMSTFAIEGNIVDHTWRQFVRRENGTIDPVAIDMLAEIVYWYRPKIERCIDTNKVIILKKYKADLLQFSYEQLEERTGHSKKQLVSGFKTLERLNIANRVFRTIKAGGLTLSNVLFIRLNSKQLQNLKTKNLNNSYPLSLQGDTPPPCKETPPLPPGRDVYREYNETTEETIDSDSIDSFASLSFPSEAKIAENTQSQDKQKRMKQQISQALASKGATPIDIKGVLNSYDPPVIEQAIMRYQTFNKATAVKAGMEPANSEDIHFEKRFMPYFHGICKNLQAKSDKC